MEDEAPSYFSLQPRLMHCRPEYFTRNSEMTSAYVGAAIMMLMAIFTRSQIVHKLFSAMANSAKSSSLGSLVFFLPPSFPIFRSIFFSPFFLSHYHSLSFFICLSISISSLAISLYLPIPLHALSPSHLIFSYPLFLSFHLLFPSHFISSLPISFHRIRIRIRIRIIFILPM